MKANERVKFGSTHSLPQHKMEVIGQLHEMSALLSEKCPPMPLNRRADGSHADQHAL
jgi:hypothetical protein